MFKRILMACDGSAESGPALHTGIHLAKALNAELRAVSVQEKLPVYATYVDVGMPGGTVILRQDAAKYYRELQAIAQQTALREGMVLLTELVEGEEVQEIVECVQRTRSDRLVVGIPRHSWLLSRLWNHTTHDLSQRMGSSILPVH